MIVERGFTVIELVIVCAVAAILWSLALPALSSFVQRHEASLAINRVIGAIHYGRTEAITHGRTVTLCPIGTFTNCGDNWRTGIMIFIDFNSNGEMDPEDELQRITPAFREGSSLSLEAFGSDRYLRFSPLGLTYSQNGTFKYCPPTKDIRFAELAVLNKAGRVYRPADTDGDGVVNVRNGGNVSCL